MNQIQQIADKVGQMSANHGLNPEYKIALTKAEYVILLLDKAIKWNLPSDEVMAEIKQVLTNN